MTFAKAEALMELQSFRTEPAPPQTQRMTTTCSVKMLSPSPQKSSPLNYMETKRMAKIPMFTLKLTSTIEPILQVDIKVAEGCEKRCVVYEGQTAEEVAETFAATYSLTAEAKATFYIALKEELSKYTTSATTTI